MQAILRFLDRVIASLVGGLMRLLGWAAALAKSLPSNNGAATVSGS